MKSKKEMLEMAKKCRELRKWIPEFSAFQDNNWKSLDTYTRVLELCQDEKKYQVRRRLNDKLKLLGEDDWMGNPEVQAYDWILENNDTPLADDESIEIFKMKAQEESSG